MSYRQDDVNDQWRNMYGQDSSGYSGRRKPQLPAMGSLIPDEGEGNHPSMQWYPHGIDTSAVVGRQTTSSMEFSRNYATAANHAGHTSAGQAIDYSVDSSYTATRKYATELAGQPSFSTFVAEPEPFGSYASSGSSTDRYFGFAQAANSYDRQNMRPSSFARDGFTRNTSDAFGNFGDEVNNLQRSRSNNYRQGSEFNRDHQGQFGFATSESFDSNNSALHKKMPGHRDESGTTGIRQGSEFNRDFRGQQGLSASFDSINSLRQHRREESGISGVSNPYPTLSENTIQSSGPRRTTTIQKPLPKEGRAMPAPTDTVEVAMPKPRISRRWMSTISKRREPDLQRGVVTVKTRDKSAIPPDEHVVVCLHCQTFCQVKKSALLVTCGSCNKVSPASQSNKASQQGIERP